MAQRQRSKIIIVEQGMSGDDKRVSPLIDKAREGGFKVAIAVNLQDEWLPPEGACGCEEVGRHLIAGHARLSWTGAKIRDDCRIRHHLA